VNCLAAWRETARCDSLSQFSQTSTCVEEADGRCMLREERYSCQDWNTTNVEEARDDRIFVETGEDGSFVGTEDEEDILKEKQENVSIIKLEENIFKDNIFMSEKIGEKKGKESSENQAPKFPDFTETIPNCAGPICLPWTIVMKELVQIEICLLFSVDEQKELEFCPEQKL